MLGLWGFLSKYSNSMVFANLHFVSVTYWNRNPSVITFERSHYKPIGLRSWWTETETLVPQVKI